MSSQESPELDLLRAKYREHASRPFPQKTDVPEEIGELHGDLAVYDVEIAGLLSWVVDGKRFWRTYWRNRQLGRRIQSLLQRHPGHSQLLHWYEREYEELQEMITIAEVSARKNPAFVRGEKLLRLGGKLFVGGVLLLIAYGIASAFQMDYVILAFLALGLLLLFFGASAGIAGLFYQKSAKPASQVARIRGTRPTSPFSRAVNS